MVKTNQESLEVNEVIRAREYQAHQTKLKSTLLFGIAVLIAALYVFFFVGGLIRWPLLAVLLTVYIMMRFI